MSDLEKYGHHLYGCDKSQPIENPWMNVRCTCGEGTGSIHELWCERSKAFRELEPKQDAEIKARRCTCGFEEAVEHEKARA